MLTPQNGQTHSNNSSAKSIGPFRGIGASRVNYKIDPQLREKWFVTSYNFIVRVLGHF